MKRKRENPSAMRCPYCGSPVILRSADGIYRENANGTMLYVCKRYPACDAYVRTHPGTSRPVGTLANGELRALRREAHCYFDKLYLSGRMSKEQAYAWLAHLLQAPLSEAHIGHLGEYYCRQVIDASRTMLASYKERCLMTLNDAQRKQVENNIGLVGKVIRDRVHGISQPSIYSYDDLFQIGCIGLCKAAATDKGSCFSTYAYRLIWNEICSALIYANRRAGAERLMEPEIMPPYSSEPVTEPTDNSLADALMAAERSASGVTAKGIRALRLMADGYTAREIGEQMGASANNVTAWVSKAKKHLRELPEVRSLK